MVAILHSDAGHYRTPSIATAAYELFTHKISGDGASGSNIEFRAAMQHQFFVLPLVGDYFLRKRIRNAMIEAAENLEMAASR